MLKLLVSVLPGDDAARIEVVELGKGRREVAVALGVDALGLDAWPWWGRCGRRGGAAARRRGESKATPIT